MVENYPELKRVEREINEGKKLLSIQKDSEHNESFNCYESHEHRSFGLNPKVEELDEETSTGHKYEDNGNIEYHKQGKVKEMVVHEGSFYKRNENDRKYFTNKKDMLIEKIDVHV